MALIELTTNLKSLTNKQTGAQSLLVSKDINDPPKTGGIAVQANARIDDLVRHTKLLTRKPGLKFLGNQALLAQTDMKKFIANQKGKKLKAIAKNVKDRALETLENTALATASILGQVPVNGTGTHFIRGFKKGGNTYLGEHGMKLSSFNAPDGTIIPNIDPNEKSAGTFFVDPENKTTKLGDTSKNKFLSIVNKAKKYIKLGDIFQVVLSQRFETKLTKKPIDIYKKLRITNPSPFMFFFNFTDFQIIGASPEILVRLRDGEITVRPIAGTRPRGKTIKEDRFYEKDLLKDKKELSEHLMLLDLGRNDAGKVSKTNSIKVTESFIIERYSHVMHIVSNVIGKHDKRFSKFKSLLAGFPAGTVSGAPKIRAMEIIDELESTKRKVYAGGIGYFAANGEFDTCIALRTAVAKNNRFYVQAGAGIVADSKPLKEYEETVNKAKALINALK